MKNTKKISHESPSTSSTSQKTPKNVGNNLLVPASATYKEEDLIRVIKKDIDNKGLFDTLASKTKTDDILELISAVTKTLSSNKIPSESIINLFNSSILSDGLKGQSKQIETNEFVLNKISLSLFSSSSGEVIDPERMKIQNKDKGYVALWTNRYAMFHFFKRYYAPFLAIPKRPPSYSSNSIEKLKEESEYANLCSEVEELIDLKKDFESLLRPKIEASSLIKNRTIKEKLLSDNPFSVYSHAEKYVFDAWMPIVIKKTKSFVSHTLRGKNHESDIKQLALMGFMYALERQVVAIIGDVKSAQTIPFPKRLDFSIRKIINSELPNMTGPVRVPHESPTRKNMPGESSFESWVGLSDNIDGDSETPQNLYYGSCENILIDLIDNPRDEQGKIIRLVPKKDRIRNGKAKK